MIHSFGFIVFLLMFSTSLFGNDDEKLIGGEAPATLGEYNSAISFRFEAGNCSGTKINKRTFITAAHCFLWLDTGVFKDGARPNRSVWITNEAVPKNWTGHWVEASFDVVDLHPTFVREVNRRLPYPRWSYSSAGSSYDVAVFTVHEDTPNIKIAQIDFSDFRPGTPVVQAGWGCEKSADIRRTGYGRFKKGTTNLVHPGEVTMNDTHGQVYAMVYNWITYGAAIYNRSSLCLGDSGGPLFVSTSPNNPKLIGVHSYYSFKHQTPGQLVSHFNWHTNLRNVRNWLARHLP